MIFSAICLWLLCISEIKGTELYVVDFASDPGLRIAISTPGVNCAVTAFRIDGSIVKSSNCSGALELEIREEISPTNPIILAISAKGILSQSLILDGSHSEDIIEWSPRIQNAGVFLISAEGRQSRKFLSKWPKDSVSLSDMLGRSLGQFLGISNPPTLEVGYYLTGEIRLFSEKSNISDEMISVEIQAPNLIAPFSYQLSITPLGADSYPVHVFPVPDEPGLSEFKFGLNESSLYCGHFPVFLGLKLQNEDGKADFVVAVKEPKSSFYSFRTKLESPMIVGSIFNTWDRIGIASGVFEQQTLLPISSGSPEEIPVLQSKGPIYLRFPEAWGFEPIPGMNYGIRKTGSGQDLLKSKFFIEGGGAFLDPGEYHLVVVDSRGERIIIGGEWGESIHLH